MLLGILRHVRFTQGHLPGQLDLIIALCGLRTQPKTKETLPNGYTPSEKIRSGRQTLVQGSLFAIPNILNEDTLISLCEISGFPRT